MRKGGCSWERWLTISWHQEFASQAETELDVIFAGTWADTTDVDWLPHSQRPKKKSREFPSAQPLAH